MPSSLNRVNVEGQTTRVVSRDATKSILDKRHKNQMPRTRDASKRRTEKHQRTVVRSEVHDDNKRKKNGQQIVMQVTSQSAIGTLK